MVGRRRGARRPGRLLWAGTFSTGPQTLSINTQTSALLIDGHGSAAGDEESEGGTVRRIIGRIDYRAANADQEPLFRAGIITMNADAQEAGSFPDPWVDAADFMWENQAPVAQFGSTIANFRIGWDTWNVDVRAMRRMREFDRSLVCVFENMSVTGSVRFYFVFRTLIWTP